MRWFSESSRLKFDYVNPRAKAAPIKNPPQLNGLTRQPFGPISTRSAGDIYFRPREIDSPPGHIETSTISENGASPTHQYGELHSLHAVDVSPGAKPPRCSLLCYPMPHKNSLDQSASNPLIFIGLVKTARGLRPVTTGQPYRDYPPPETKPSLLPPRTSVSAVRTTPHRPA